MLTTHVHHRSISRIKTLGEVFTPEKFVNEMLDMLSPDEDKLNFWGDINNIFFEPTCGHGNFVTAVLQRRLEACLFNAKKDKHTNPVLYSIANSINTLWAIDIDSKNIDECRFRAFTVIMNFWTQSTDSSVHYLIKNNREFFCHLLCAIRWHIHENEALSALTDELQAKKAANKTGLGMKWVLKNKLKPLDFELSWCEFYKQSIEHKFKVIEFERSSQFTKSLLLGQKMRGFDEFSFALEVITTRAAKIA